MDRDLLKGALKLLWRYDVSEEQAREALKKPWPHDLSGPGHILVSDLDNIPGMGPVRLKMLKEYFDEKAPKLRPSWDEYGLELAKTVALRADCIRRKVGAVLMMPDHSIAGTGYNGAYPGGPSCLKGECPRGLLSVDELPPNSDYSSGVGTCIALHAEWNVLLRASWDQMTGSTLYVTTEPCHLCWNLIRGTHISRVVWPDNVVTL